LTYTTQDREYSRAAGARARKRRANLFLYSSYAWDAFSQHYSHDVTKMLFQYHPHVSFEARILREDTNRFGLSSCGMEFESWSSVNDEGRTQNDDSWRLADHVICASAFTRSTLLAAGARLDQISIIPYGIDMPRRRKGGKRCDAFHVVFVG